jgi:hypothetical protein
MQVLLKLAQPGETNSKIFNEITKNSFYGVTFLKTCTMRISSQNTLLNNFSPVLPILTSTIASCIIPIDSARLQYVQLCSSGCR